VKGWTVSYDAFSSCDTKPDDVVGKVSPVVQRR
jgi:hypothetical protein